MENVSGMCAGLGSGSLPSWNRLRVICQCLHRVSMVNWRRDREIVVFLYVYDGEALPVVFGDIPPSVVADY